MEYEEFIEVCESLGVFLSGSDFQKFWYKALTSDMKQNEKFLNSEHDFGKDPEGTVNKVTESEIKTSENGKMTKISKRTYTLDDGSFYTKTNIHHSEPS